MNLTLAPMNSELTEKSESINKLNKTLNTIFMTTNLQSGRY